MSAKFVELCLYLKENDIDFDDFIDFYKRYIEGMQKMIDEREKEQQ